MASPWFVADFDSSTALLRALAASLHGRRFERLGRGRLPGLLASASAALPERLVTAAFARAGALEAIPASRFARVDPNEFAGWAVGCYPRTPVPAVVIGASDGAIVHLCAAAGIPWLPQTFLVPVRRRSDPDDVAGDVELGRRLAPRLLRAQPDLAVHQVHDANQDRLMVRQMAYFRLKLLRLPEPYKRFVAQVLRPGGWLVILDGRLRWPASQLGERHVFQAGALGGLRPQEYVAGGPRVAEFLGRQGSAVDHWDFPPIDANPPEAEWGYAEAQTGDACELARRGGYRLGRLRIDAPGAASPYVADLYRRWFAGSRRLLAETFICVDPQWSLRTRSVPFWTAFAVDDAAAALDCYTASRPGWEDIVVTLFAHGVRSAGLADARRWQHLADRATGTALLAGVNPDRWPIDFAALARYGRALSAVDRDGTPPPRLTLDKLCELADDVERPAGIGWERLS